MGKFSNLHQCTFNSAVQNYFPKPPPYFSTPTYLLMVSLPKGNEDFQDNISWLAWFSRMFFWIKQFQFWVSFGRSFSSIKKLDLLPVISPHSKILQLKCPIRNNCTSKKSLIWCKMHVHSSIPSGWVMPCFKF